MNRRCVTRLVRCGQPVVLCAQVKVLKRMRARRVIRSWFDRSRCALPPVPSTWGPLASSVEKAAACRCGLFFSGSPSGRQFAAPKKTGGETITYVATSSRSDTANNRRFAACLMIEDLALAELEDYWPEANETMRLECIEEASPTESYVALASCLMAHVREHRRR